MAVITLVADRCRCGHVMSAVSDRAFYAAAVDHQRWHVQQMRQALRDQLREEFREDLHKRGRSRTGWMDA